MTIRSPIQSFFTAEFLASHPICRTSIRSLGSDGRSQQRSASRKSLMAYQ
ncbi:hypothetical protein L842_0595 [Mycobacterium intracellulare MIN_052511_1280]|nr:hypothetical protein L842_0595 [Mycobacterium intracellulare MIN_052511_1280]